MLYCGRSGALEVTAMQKRSHTLLASALLRSQEGFDARRFELAFLFGSFQPDCNPFSYLKGSLRARKFGGHNYTNSHDYIIAHIERLQRRRTAWTMWQYYTLGKLTHYLADAFTYPHNETYPDSLMAHRQYEDELRMYLAEYLQQRTLRSQQFREDLEAAISELHRQYLESRGDLQRDVQYILQATAMLMAGCCPSAAV